MTGALRRITRLGRTEMLLLWRNRTAVVTAVLLPIGTVWFLASLNLDAGGLSAGAFAVTGLLGFVLLYVVYYNLVTTYVARREELVLKRLRTGEMTDAQILAGTAVPAVVVTLVQAVLAVVAGAALLDLAVPVNLPVLLVGLVGGIVLFVLLAVVSSTFTRNVEMAQISTMPVLVVCMIGSGLVLPLQSMPDLLADVAAFLPLTPVVELVRLGWLGTTTGADPTGFAGVFGPAVVPLLILLGWTALGVVGMRRWFRWEPRR
ncbi:ABC transporter permease [Polymorphospora rubra]|uniref:ABC transporter permease n=1 Tax=Polymorphospora rubra TaxID=338584 RepID=UPI0033FEC6B8